MSLKPTDRHALTSHGRRTLRSGLRGALIWTVVAVSATAALAYPNWSSNVEAAVSARPQADEQTPEWPPPEGNGPPPDASLPPSDASPVDVGALPSDGPPPGNGPPPGASEAASPEPIPAASPAADTPPALLGPPPGAPQADGSPDASLVPSGSVCLIGILSTIYGGPGGPIIFLADTTTGQQTQILLHEDVARPAGGLRVLDRQRVTVKGEPAGQSASGESLVRATWIALGDQGCG